LVKQGAHGTGQPNRGVAVGNGDPAILNGRDESIIGLIR
jgi:hypothetical protein